MQYKDGAISIANNCFYIDSELILNCNDRLHNYSRVPGHRIEDTGVKTISELVIENSKLHKDLFCGTPNMVYQNACFLCDCIIADLFMHKGEPLKAAEIGCNNGLLTAHFAPLLSAFDPNAKYVCVSNTIGNESNNIWLDIISQINTPEGFAFIASDFSETFLCDSFFELVVINGTTQLSDPIAVVKEAMRITSENGHVLCLSSKNFILEDAFYLFFDEIKEWRFRDGVTVMSAKGTDCWV